MPNPRRLGARSSPEIIDLRATRCSICTATRTVSGAKQSCTEWLFLQKNHRRGRSQAAMRKRHGFDDHHHEMTNTSHRLQVLFGGVASTAAPSSLVHATVCVHTSHGGQIARRSANATSRPARGNRRGVRPLAHGADRGGAARWRASQLRSRDRARYAVDALRYAMRSWRSPSFFRPAKIIFVPCQSVPQCAGGETGGASAGG